VTEPGTTEGHNSPGSTQLALERTRLAYERTLLAWVRTAVSLISFGFTVYKFFQYLHDSGQGHHSARLLGPREFALLMIGVGLVALLLATVEHHRSIRVMREQFGSVPRSLAGAFAGLVACLGLIGFLTVIFRE
jgi:putative membrane protein